MRNETEQMQVKFHNKAREIFFPLLNDFDAAIIGLDRKREEYRFQQMKNEYSSTLKNRLELLAQDILQSYKNEQRSTEINQLFQQLIRDYLHRFVQKINFS